MLYAIFAVLVIILDQGVKYWVAGAIHMESAGETFIPGILSIVNVQNKGAAFSFLSGSNPRIFFIILTGVFTVLVIIALATKFISGPLARWSIVMVTAGGISNCIDRVIYGYVQDMFKCEFVDFPVFNVADIFITVFALLFIIAIIFERDRRRDFQFDDEEEFDEEDEDFEEEEEERPRRKSRKEKKALRRTAREEEEDEEEEEEEPPRRLSRKEKKALRRAAREEDEEEEEEAPARSRRAAAPAKPAPAAAEPARKARTSKYDAEYEQFKARRAAAQKQAAAQAAEPAPAAKPAAPAAKPAPEPAPAPAPKPAAPAAEPKPFSADTEFSLDDILAEFK